MFQESNLSLILNPNHCTLDDFLARPSDLRLMPRRRQDVVAVAVAGAASGSYLFAVVP
jgi:hypothetical protein